MKKVLSFLSLIFLLGVQSGCESHHGEDYKEQQQETPENVVLPKPTPEHGGNAGNK